MSESYSVDYVTRHTVNQFKLDMLLIPAHHLACAVIIHIVCAEKRAWIARAVRCKLLQVAKQLFRYVLEVNHSLHVKYRLSLLGQDMLIHISLKTLLECRNIFHLHRQTGCIRMTAEIVQKVAATLYGVIDVETSH